MVYALKVENRNKIPVTQFILYGLNRFRQAPHTQDYEPAQIEMNPKDREKLPSRFSVNNIPVVGNDELEPGFLRVCTEDIQGLDA